MSKTLLSSPHAISLADDRRSKRFEDIRDYFDRDFQTKVLSKPLCPADYLSGTTPLHIPNSLYARVVQYQALQKQIEAKQEKEKRMIKGLLG